MSSKSHDHKLLLVSSQKCASCSLVQVCYLAVIKLISGCDRIACSGLMTTSLLQVANRLDPSCFDNFQQVRKYQVASCLFFTDLMQLDGATQAQCNLTGGGGEIDNWGEAHIHIFVFTDCKNNRFQNKSMMHHTNI